LVLGAGAVEHHRLTPIARRAWLFGGRAGAVVVEASDDDRLGIIDFEGISWDGSGGAADVHAGRCKHAARVAGTTVDPRPALVKQGSGASFSSPCGNTEEAARTHIEPAMAVKAVRKITSSLHQTTEDLLSATETARHSAGEGRPQHRAFRNTMPARFRGAPRRGRAEETVKQEICASCVGRAGFFTVGTVLLHRWGLKQ